MDKPTFVYVTYITTTLEKVWDALTSEAFTQHYWGDGQLQSDWQVGSFVQHINVEGESDWQGEVLQSEAPHLLSYTFEPLDVTAVQPSRVRFMLEQCEEAVKLTLIHDQLTTQSCLALSQEWSTRLCYLKRLLELEERLAFVA